MLVLETQEVATDLASHIHDEKVRVRRGDDVGATPTEGFGFDAERQGHHRGQIEHGVDVVDPLPVGSGAS